MFYDDFYRHLVFTSHIIISRFCLSTNNSTVIVRGSYGNFQDDSIFDKPIDFVTTVNDLLRLISEARLRDDFFKEQLLEAVKDSDHYHHFIAPSAMFFEHIFSFSRIDHSLGVYYKLNGFVKRNKMFPNFKDFTWPTTKRAFSFYKSKFLAMQYYLYLSFQKTHSKQEALEFSGLTDREKLATAKKKYERKYGKKLPPVTY